MRNCRWQLGAWHAIWVVFCVSCLAGSALAHSSSRSFSEWREEGQNIQMIFSIERVQATLLIPLQDQNLPLASVLSGHLAASIHVSRLGDVSLCQPSLPQQMPSSPETLRIRMVFNCGSGDQAAGWSIENNAFFDLASTHIHIAQLQSQDQQTEQVFTNARRSHVLRGVAGEHADVSLWANIVQYIQLGFIHILSGWDHLAFVVGLIILAGSLRKTVFLVTGFTVGHSLTLGLVALGWVQPVTPAIEALIGFSIAFVAMEFLLSGGSWWRSVTKWLAALFAGFAILALFGFGQLPSLVWVGLGLFVYSTGQLEAKSRPGLSGALILTTIFGLVHGAGFATPLMEAGLPIGRQIPALAGFNIGVEVGQLLVVVIWLLVFGLITKLAGQQRTTQTQIAMSGLILVLGMFWFSGRALIG